MEDKIYYWVGLVAVWAGVGYITIKIIGLTLVALINWAGNRFDKMWFFMEFLYYREDFKEYVKDKQRHPRVKKH